MGINLAIGKRPCATFGNSDEDRGRLDLDRWRRRRTASVPLLTEHSGIPPGHGG